MPDEYMPPGSHASPGVGGALHDFIQSISRALAPRSIVQRKAKLDQQQSEAEGTDQPLGDQFQPR